MIRKALKNILPSAVGAVFGLAVALIIFGTDVAVKTIIPVLVGIAAAFIASLYFAKKGNK